MKSMIPAARPALLSLVVMSLAVVTVPSTAQADDSFLNYVLPWVFGKPEEGPKPQDTLQAPFGNDEPKVTGKPQTELMKIYEADQAALHTEGGLDQPHRSAEQVGEWISSVVTQALTIDPTTYAEKSKGYTGVFLPYALQEYQTYLGSNQTLQTLTANNMRLSAFAESKPVLVQEGVLEGSYRWLYRVPVMLTYYDRVTTSLKGKKPTSQTQRVMVNIQIGRVASTRLADGMAVERWSVSAQ